MRIPSAAHHHWALTRRRSSTIVQVLTCDRHFATAPCPPGLADIFLGFNRYRLERRCGAVGSTKMDSSAEDDRIVATPEENGSGGDNVGLVLCGDAPIREAGGAGLVGMCASGYQRPHEVD